MPSKRKFYRSTFFVEVLSEEPISDGIELADVAHQIVDGDWSGQVTSELNQEVDGPQMAMLLRNQASDPEFFQLDEDGNDLDEEI